MVHHYIKKQVTPPPNLYLHLLRNSILGLMLIALALYIGMLGYHEFEHMSWVDAYVNAAMILGGMGPVDPLHTDTGKLFAGSYALFSGLAFIAIVAIMLSPVVHKFFRKIHLESTGTEDDAAAEDAPVSRRLN